MGGPSSTKEHPWRPCEPYGFNKKMAVKGASTGLQLAGCRECSGVAFNGVLLAEGKANTS